MTSSNSSSNGAGADDDERRWDVEESRRSRRANRGNLLQELLEKGLNSDEEHLLNDLSDATTDSTFSASGEEAMDEVDSDFSDEEVEGVLDGAEVETDAMLQQQERQERKKERQQALRRMGGGTTRTNNNSNSVKSATLRLRPPPTIPLEERLREARKRAREVRAAAAATAVGEEREDMNGTGGASQYNVGAAMTRRRRPYRTRGTATGTTAGIGEDDGEEVVQRVMYTSSRSVLEQFGVPVVISFSKCLPRLFQTK
ncbi:Vps72/YL1 family [Trypanosoma melophagium]|uniref:Vps72/YL1 family n=1 Tax=Trypanosoma melophagium TaxID=715481 RepID=UPI00351A7624|nr:Vps72/YL1 family [Trypanosoma melophagium]